MEALLLPAIIAISALSLAMFVGYSIGYVTGLETASKMFDEANKILEHKLKAEAEQFQDDDLPDFRSKY